MIKAHIENIVNEALIELGLTDTSMIPIFTVWAYEAQRSIGISGLQKKETDWKRIDNFVLRKPKDIFAPVRVIISKDKSDCLLPYIDSSKIQCGCCENCLTQCEITMGETANTYFLSGNAGEYMHYKIVYYGLPIDEEGKPVVDERNQRAVKQYISYMWTKRERKRDRKGVPQSEVESEYNIWVRLKGEAQGEQKMIGPLDMREIARIFLNAGVPPIGREYHD